MAEKETNNSGLAFAVAQWKDAYILQCRVSILTFDMNASFINYLSYLSLGA